MYNKEKGPDGYPSWMKFVEEVKSNDACPRDIAVGLRHGGYPCAIRTKDGGEVTLYPDGTWQYDCAPDWDGSS